MIKISIIIYTGTPGSGKSLHAAGDLRYALNKPGKPRPCIVNFEIPDNAPVKHRDMVTCVENDELSPDFLVNYAESYWYSCGHDFREDWVLCILDEVQLLFNSRRWNDSHRLAWLQFFSQHRKYGYKIVFVCQSAKMIDNQFRQLIDVEVNHRAVRHMGGVGAVASILTFDRLFMWVSYLFQTQERLGMSLYFRTNKDSAMYDTRARFKQQRK